MDKIQYIKLENEDGTFSNNIPLSVDANYVDVGGDNLANKLNTLATKTEVAAIASGSPAGVYTTVAALIAADPDHSKIYVVTENGHWYYYNGSDWADGGIYQSSGVANESIDYKNFTNELKNDINNRTYVNNELNYNDYEINLDDYGNWVNKNIDSITGEISTNNSTVLTHEKLIYIPNNVKIKIEVLNSFLSSNDYYDIYGYDNKKNYLGKCDRFNDINPSDFKFSYIRLRIVKSNILPGDILNFKMTISQIYSKNIKYINTNINLINPEVVNYNKYLAPMTYRLADSNDYDTTDFIAIDQSIYTTLNRIRMYVLYDEYKRKIQDSFEENIDENSQINFTNSSAKFIRLTYYKTDSNIMFYKGSEIIPYEPFKKILEKTSALSDTMKTEVDDLINDIKNDIKNDLKLRTTNEAQLDYEQSITIDLNSYDWINKDISNATGEWTSYNSSVLINSKFIYIPKKCRINLSLLNDFTINYYDIYQYTEDGTYLGVTVRGDVIEPFEIEGTYIRIRIVKSNIVANNIVNIKLILQKELSRKIEYIGTNINLINPETEYKNKYINQTNFKLKDGTSYNTTDFIPVKYNTVYTTLCRIRMYVLYNKYKTRISSAIENIAANTQLTFSDENVGYIRISYYNADSYPMFYEGDTVVSYKPFKKILEDSASLSKTMESEVNDLIANVNAQNILTGKKLVTCGDSFTQYTNATFDGGIYDGHNKVWPYLIGLRNDMTVHNMAISGATMTNGDFESSNKFSANLYKQIDEDADYIILKFGINDENYQAPIGTINDTENTTFYGAWNTVMPYIIEHHPTAKIGIIVTNGLVIHTEHPNNSVYANAIIEIAKKYGIPTLNEWNDPNVPLLLRTGRTDVDESIRNMRLATFRVTQSNTHENYICHEYESTFIEDFLRRL